MTCIQALKSYVASLYRLTLDNCQSSDVYLCNDFDTYLKSGELQRQSNFGALFSLLNDTWQLIPSIVGKFVVDYSALS